MWLPHLQQPQAKQLSTAAGGYDATDDRGRRRSPPTIVKSEDDIAKERHRRILSASSRDLARNFAIAAWAIRKHLDFVSRFSFRAATDDEAFNDDLEAAMREKMRPQEYDLAGRHHFTQAVRISEACRVMDGDVFWVKMGSGAGRVRGRVQHVEGDKCRMSNREMPTNFQDPDRWSNGVRIGRNGESQAFAFCDRGRNGGYELRRIVPSRNVLHHAFFERFDQYRGISPIASGLNWFRDTYEGFEYMLAKVKVAQLFGLAFTRDGMMNPFGAVQATGDADGDGANDSDFEVALPQGMFSLDLDIGEKAEILESKTPAAETVDFLKLMIHVALKSLDIPYSFFDESFTNFYGSRGGLIQYLNTCKQPIGMLQQLQTNWANFRIGMMVADRELTLPSGRGFDFVRFEFVPDGIPWWDRVKEARGAAMEIAAGFSSPQRICREIGTDFESNITETAEAIRFADEKGVKLVFADSTAFRPEIVAGGEDDAAA